MGKWKYVNFLVIGFILFFMFRTLATRYHVSVGSYVWVIGGIVLIGVAGYYLFIAAFYPEKKKTDDSNDDFPPPDIVPPKPRPKVVLKLKRMPNE